MVRFPTWLVGVTFAVLIGLAFLAIRVDAKPFYFVYGVSFVVFLGMLGYEIYQRLVPKLRN